MPETAPRGDHPPPEALLHDVGALEAELLAGEDLPAQSAYHASIRERARGFAEAASLAARMGDEIEGLHQGMDALDATYFERAGEVATARERLQAQVNALQERIDLLTSEIALLEQRADESKSGHHWGVAWRLAKLYAYVQDFCRDLKLGKQARSAKFPAGTLTFYHNKSRLEWIKEVIDPQSGEEGKRDDAAILEALSVLSKLGLYHLHQQFVRTEVTIRADDLKQAVSVEPGECWFDLIVPAAQMTAEIAAAVNEGWVTVKPGSIDTTTGDIHNWMVRIPAMYERKSEGGEVILRSPILRRVEPAEPYTLGWKRARPSTAKEATETDERPTDD